MAKEKCINSNKNSKIKVEENKRKAVFLNPSRDEFSITKVDGCVIPRGVTAADYLVVKHKSSSVLVELKGSGIDHACRRLFSTVSNEKVRDLIEGELGFLVICSKFPRFDTIVAKAKQKAAKEFKAGFHVVCNKGEFVIEKCVKIDGPY